MELIPRKACRYNLRPLKSRPYYFEGRKKRIKSRTEWHDLPDDIKHLILLKLSTQHIYNVMRSVCSDWCNTVLHDPSFINLHLKNSNHGLLLRSFLSDRIEFIEATINPNDGEVVVNYDHTLDYSISSGGCIYSTCNGLILEFEEDWGFLLLNPVTKQKLHITAPISGITTGCQLGYVVSSGKYKMVKHSNGPSINKMMSTVEILTLGPNQKWRYLCTLPFIKKIYSAGGLIHWIEIDKESRLVSLNLETETFRELPYPSHVDRKTFLAMMGDKLSFVNMEGEKRLLFEIWVLVEEHDKNVVWMKVCDVDLQRWKPEKICNPSIICPVGWLKAMEVIIFSFGFDKGFYIAYDIKTHEILVIFTVGDGARHEYAHSFVSSLFSPDTIFHG